MVNFLMIMFVFKNYLGLLCFIFLYKLINYYLMLFIVLVNCKVGTEQ